MPRIAVAAFYRFVPLPERETLRTTLLEKCRALDLRGSILLAAEGINSTLAGAPEAVTALHEFFDTIPELANMPWKISYCAEQPFGRMLVKRKKEIVTMGVPDLPVAGHEGTYVAPDQWDELLANPQVTLIDTRNTYEMAEGTFAGARNPQIRNFRQFPAWMEQQQLDPQQPVAMFCTGGIRCEKATAWLRQKGFQQVYHLQGGILAYLEKTTNPRGNWQGTCYVFDERGTVDGALQPVPRTVEQNHQAHSEP